MWATTRRGPSLPRNPAGDAGFDVVHLAIQDGFSTVLPYVYSPYDLQHLHLPQFFTQSQRTRRNHIYRRLALGAEAVTLMTAWGADDLCDNFPVQRDRVFVVPPGTRRRTPTSPSAASAVLHSLGASFTDFALYPAQTWPHKNHLALLEVIAQLRVEGIAIPLVCTGHRNEHYRSLQKAVTRLGLQDLVVFTGYVEDAALGALYGRARCLVFPSLFEGWGMPIFDALADGLPVAATNCCGLGEILTGAASLFSPTDLDAMATSIRAVWTDEAVRTRLANRGKELTRELTWTRSARTLSAIYRAAAGQPALPEDQRFLAQATAWRQPNLAS